MSGLKYSVGPLAILKSKAISLIERLLISLNKGLLVLYKCLDISDKFKSFIVAFGLILSSNGMLLVSEINFFYIQF